MVTKNKIEVRNLCYARNHQSLFSNLSFFVNAHELLWVHGPNGSGKSSLLRLLTGFSTPEEGDIYWQHQSIYALQKDYWQHLHYVGHQNGIKLGLTVFENLALSTYYSANDFLDLARIRSDAILSHFQLGNYKNTQAKFLSAGLRRRLALAKLLVVPKTIWILDEPTTALDHTIERLFLDYLKRHLQQGGIAIISSHHDISLKDVTIKTLRLGT